jgi:hypothetical protein
VWKFLLENRYFRELTNPPLSFENMCLMQRLVENPVRSINAAMAIQARVDSQLEEYLLTPREVWIMTAKLVYTLRTSRTSWECLECYTVYVECLIHEIEYWQDFGMWSRWCEQVRLHNTLRPTRTRPSPNNTSGPDIYNDNGNRSYSSSPTEGSSLAVPSNRQTTDLRCRLNPASSSPELQLTREKERRQSLKEVDDLWSTHGALHTMPQRPLFICPDQGDNQNTVNLAPVRLEARSSATSPSPTATVSAIAPISRSRSPDTIVGMGRGFCKRGFRGRDRYTSLRTRNYKEDPVERAKRKDRHIQAMLDSSRLKVDEGTQTERDLLARERELQQRAEACDARENELKEKELKLQAHIQEQARKSHQETKNEAVVDWEFLAPKAASEAYRLQAKLSDPDEECLELAGAYNPEELRKESPENMQHLPQARFDLTSDIPSTSAFSTSDLPPPIFTLPSQALNSTFLPGRTQSFFNGSSDSWLRARSAWIGALVWLGPFCGWRCMAGTWG